MASIAWMRPLGPVFMRLLNRGVDKDRTQEMVDLGMPNTGKPDVIVAETEELCGTYARLQPDHARHWNAAVELVKAHAQGTGACLDLIERWGFVKDNARHVGAPEWWNDKMVVPIEFMDYAPEMYSDDAVRAAGTTPERFHTLARQTSERVWMGYYRAKGRLCAGGVSLLIKDVTDAANQMKARVDKPRDAPLCVYVIGISEDEVVALQGPDTCVIGFNRGHSPIVEKFIREGRVGRLVAEGAGNQAKLFHADTREPFRPEGGKVYICPGDVTNGLPVPDASGIAMTNYTLHHNSFATQDVMIRELHRTALPLHGGGRAFVVGEMIRNRHFIPTLFGPVSTIGPTTWDAWASFANGIITVEHQRKKREQWADEGIHLRFSEVPGSLASAPSFVHWLVMPPTKVLITCN